MIRSKNSINVAIKNLVDFCLSAWLFWLVGFGVMFGSSYAGFLGTTHFAFNHNDDPWLLSFFMFQLVFCGTATTIVSGAVAERMRFTGYFVVCMLISCLVYPVFGHWAWGGVLEGMGEGWLQRRGFIDFAGSTVVHSTGGWVALAGVIILGPRLGRFREDASPIHGHNLPLAVLGVLILWFGWLGFNSGSTLRVTDAIPGIAVNTTLSAASGGVFVLALTWLIHRRWCIEPLMNGVIAGLVGITAGCHLVSLFGAVCIGMTASGVCFMATRWLEKLKIDDAIRVIPAHAFAGAWGTLAVALLSDPQQWGTGLGRWEQLWVQAMGVGVCFLWSFGVTLPILWLINRRWPFRVDPETEMIGLNIAEHGASSETLDLLRSMNHQRETGDFSQDVHVEPHTEIGQIASQYNGVLTRMNQEIEWRQDDEEQIRKMHQEIDDMVKSIPLIVIGLDLEERVSRWNHTAEVVFQIPAQDVLGRFFRDCPIAWEWGQYDQTIKDCILHNKPMKVESTVLGDTGAKAQTISYTVNPVRSDGYTISGYLLVGDDVTDQQALQQQLQQAQKLESIGQLAAGVAHEINTPTLFVGNNTRFLQDSFHDLQGVLSSYQTLMEHCREKGVLPDLVERVETEIDKADIEYLTQEIPKAIDQTLEGVERVATIVQSMKEFSHPGGQEKAMIDLNKAIDSTITVSSNEWKYISEMVKDFSDDLPLVPCFPGEFNQVILNMIVNAAQAIDEAAKDGQKGQITISTAVVGRYAQIRISDTGPGIPEQALSKIFDPFFTTKEVGKGTGQGLALAHRFIVEKLGGKLQCESTVGRGTTFIISIPLEDSKPRDTDQR